MNESMYTEGFVRTVEAWDGSLLAPSSENRRHEGIPVFKADWFERVFAKAHPIVPGIAWGPLAVLCFYGNANDPRFDMSRTVVTCVLGFLAWTLIEYLLHRYVFHVVPEPSFDSKLRQFMVHGYHHEFPNDRMRLVAPLLLSIPIGAVIAVGYVLLLGPYYCLSWFAGTTLGYLTYDWMHYYTHHFRPTTRLGKFLRRYHMEHHYKDSESHFGISSPLWDWIFGTARSRPTEAAPAQEAFGEPGT